MGRTVFGGRWVFHPGLPGGRPLAAGEKRLGQEAPTHSRVVQDLLRRVPGATHLQKIRSLGLSLSLPKACGMSQVGMSPALGVLSGEQASRAGSSGCSPGPFQHPTVATDGGSEPGKDYQSGFKFLLYQLCCVTGTSPFQFLPL